MDKPQNPYPQPHKNTAIEECQRVAWELCANAMDAYYKTLFNPGICNL